MGAEVVRCSRSCQMMGSWEVLGDVSMKEILSFDDGDGVQTASMSGIEVRAPEDMLDTK